MFRKFTDTPFSSFLNEGVVKQMFCLSMETEIQYRKEIPLYSIVLRKLIYRFFPIAQAA